MKYLLEGLIAVMIIRQGNGQSRGRPFLRGMFWSFVLLVLWVLYAGSTGNGVHK